MTDGNQGGRQLLPHDPDAEVSFRSRVILVTAGALATLAYVGWWGWVLFGFGAP